MKPAPTIIATIGEADNGQDAISVTVKSAAGAEVAHMVLSGDLKELASIGKEVAGRFLPDAPKPKP